MWKTVKKILFASFEKSWRIEGPADTNMQLMRELAKQNSYEVLIDKDSLVSFTCRVWSLPSVSNFGNFEKVVCQLKQVAPHRCYLTVKFKTSQLLIMIFCSLTAMGFAFAAYAEKEYLFLLFIPLVYAIGTRFAGLGTWAQRYRVHRFFKDKLFIIDNSTAS